MTPPASIIEPAIALSIVYVGADNLLVKGGRDVRAGIAFVFGLIHGLGFSSFLRSLLGGEESIVGPLFAFNVGLEVGQLFIVAGVMLLGLLAERLLRLTRREWVLVLCGGTMAVAITMIVDRIHPIT